VKGGVAFPERNKGESYLKKPNVIQQFKTICLRVILELDDAA
jgi:hypothetical protein